MPLPPAPVAPDSGEAGGHTHLVEIPRGALPGDSLVIHCESGMSKILVMPGRDRMDELTAERWPSLRPADMVAGFTVPAVVLGLTILLRFLVLQRKLSSSDFMLGLDATIAALAAAVLRIFDLGCRFSDAAVIGDLGSKDFVRTHIFNAMIRSGIFLLMVIAVLVVVLVIYKKFGEPTKRRDPAEAAKESRQRWWAMAVVANGLGFGILFLSVVFLRAPSY